MNINHWMPIKDYINSLQEAMQFLSRNIKLMTNSPKGGLYGRHLQNLKDLGYIERVKRGVYKKIKYIPENLSGRDAARTAAPIRWR